MEITTGYCFSSLEEALTVAEPLPGRSVNAVASLCKELGVYAVVGLVEKEGANCFNMAIVEVEKELAIACVFKVRNLQDAL
jgi:predicted amidohydrolase